jgi:hypothetical protein
METAVLQRDLMRYYRTAQYVECKKSSDETNYFVITDKNEWPHQSESTTQFKTGKKYL